MRTFQNNTGRDIYIFNREGDTHCLKKNTQIQGERLDTNLIWTREFGKVYCNDTYQYVLKEIHCDEELWTTGTIVHEKGVFVKSSCDITSPTLFFIPCGETCTIVSRITYVSQCCYYICYHDEYGWIMNETVLRLNPMTRTVMVRVTDQDGVIVRREKEIHSPVIGYIPYNSILMVCKKDWSLYPSTNHVRRLELYQQKGWISYHVEVIGYPTTMLLKKYKDPCIIDFTNSPFVGIRKKKSTNQCCICLQNKVEATFVHGNYGHTVCCMECAKQCDQKPCPICREPIEKIIQNYFE